MSGRRTFAIGLATTLGLLLAVATCAAQHAPVFDKTAASAMGMSPVVSAPGLPTAQPLEMPLFPGEESKRWSLTRRSATPRVAMADVSAVEGGIDWGDDDFSASGLPSSSYSSQVVSGCASCGTIGDACGCGNGSMSGDLEMLPSLAFPKRTRVSLFYEWLYLRARNADVAYAVPVDGPVAAGGEGIQIGPVAVVDHDYESDDSYRVGGSLRFNDGAQLGGGYTRYKNRESDQSFTEAPNVLRSLLNHPLADNAAIDSLRADAQSRLEFEMADLFYQAHLFCNRRTTVDYVLGLRYAELNQRLTANYSTNDTTSVTTDVGFHGFGPRIGLDLEHEIGCLGLRVYSKGNATFVPGTGRGSYVQESSVGGTIVDTEWDSSRVMTQLDFELGLGWSPRKNYRISAGYLVSAWLNTATSTEFISAVQSNDFNNIDGDGLTFDGLVLRSNFAF